MQTLPIVIAHGSRGREIARRGAQTAPAVARPVRRGLAGARRVVAETTFRRTIRVNCRPRRRNGPWDAVTDCYRRHERPAPRPDVPPLILDLLA